MEVVPINFPFKFGRSGSVYLKVPENSFRELAALSSARLRLSYLKWVLTGRYLEKAERMLKMSLG